MSTRLERYNTLRERLSRSHIRFYENDRVLEIIRPTESHLWIEMVKLLEASRLKRVWLEHDQTQPYTYRVTRPRWSQKPKDTLPPIAEAPTVDETESQIVLSDDGSAQQTECEPRPSMHCCICLSSSDEEPTLAFHRLCPGRDCVYCETCIGTVLDEHILRPLLRACSPSPGITFTKPKCTHCFEPLCLEHWVPHLGLLKSHSYSITDLPHHRNLSPLELWDRARALVAARTANARTMEFAWPSYCPCCPMYQMFSRYEQEVPVVATCVTGGIQYCTTCSTICTNKRQITAHTKSCYRFHYHTLWHSGQMIPKVPPLLARYTFNPQIVLTETYKPWEEQQQLVQQTREFLEAWIDYAAEIHCPNPTCRYPLSKFKEDKVSGCNWTQCPQCLLGVCLCCGRQVATRASEYFERRALEDGTLAFMEWKEQGELRPEHATRIKELPHSCHVTNQYAPGGRAHKRDAQFAPQVRFQWNALWTSLWGDTNDYSTRTDNIHVPAPTFLGRVCPFSMATVFGATGLYEYAQNELPTTMRTPLFQNTTLDEDQAMKVFSQLRQAEFLWRCVRGWFASYQQLPLFEHALQASYCLSASVVRDHVHFLTRLGVRASMRATASHHALTQYHIPAVAAMAAPIPSLPTTPCKKVRSRRATIRVRVMDVTRKRPLDGLVLHARISGKRARITVE